MQISKQLIIVLGGIFGILLIAGTLFLAKYVQTSKLDLGDSIKCPNIFTRTKVDGYTWSNTSNNFLIQAGDKIYEGYIEECTPKLKEIYKLDSNNTGIRLCDRSGFFVTYSLSDQFNPQIIRRDVNEKLPNMFPLYCNSQFIVFQNLYGSLEGITVLDLNDFSTEEIKLPADTYSLLLNKQRDLIYFAEVNNQKGIFFENKLFLEEGNFGHWDITGDTLYFTAAKHGQTELFSKKLGQQHQRKLGTYKFSLARPFVISPDKKYLITADIEGYLQIFSLKAHGFTEQE